MDNLFPLKLHDHIATIAPIKGVRIVKVDDRSTWQIVFLDSATDPQKAAAQAALLVFDPPPDDPTDIESGSFNKRERIILAAAALLAGIPPNQVRAAIKLRVAQANQLIG